MLVTASVDAIQLRRRLAIETDMTIQGQVVWTGSSSMDIRMELTQVSSSLPCGMWDVSPPSSIDLSYHTSCPLQTQERLHRTSNGIISLCLKHRETKKRSD